MLNAVVMSCTQVVMIDVCSAHVGGGFVDILHHAISLDISLNIIRVAQQWE